MFTGCPSVRPSVRSLKYHLLTCTWVRWSTRPTVTVLRHVRPSVWVFCRQLELTELTRPDLHHVVGLFILRDVRPSVCPSVRPSGEVYGHLPANAWREWPEIYMLMCLDHLQNWLVYGRGLLIFLILAPFWLSETGQKWGFRAFPEKHIEEMAWNFVRWCILTTSTTD